MATEKFKKASPYVTVPPNPPIEDVIHQKYTENLKLVNDGKTPRFGFALFGVGRAGTIHLSFLVKDPRVELLYIVDDDKSKWDKIKRHWELQSVKFLTNSEAGAVYKDPKVRAVVVASPTYTHEEIVKKALDHNKGVFCEKPVAENLEQTKACYEQAKRAKQPLFSAFNSRDSPLPSIEYLKSSGGIFHDCAVHDIDMTLYILGEYPTRVAVAAAANIPEIAEIDDYDTVGIILTFASGAVGIIDLSRYSIYGYDQRVEVFGQKGMIKAENQQPIHNVETYTERGVVKAPIAYSFPSRYSEGYDIEMRHFLDVLEGKSEICIDTKDVLAVSRIASACEEAAKTGKCVDIKWNPEDLPQSK